MEEEFYHVRNYTRMSNGQADVRHSWLFPARAEICDLMIADWLGSPNPVVNIALRPSVSIIPDVSV